MDAEDRELFERSIAAVVADESGPGLDRAIRDLGWHEALVDDDQAAISILFEHLGRSNATSGALDHVIAAGSGIDADAAGVVLPTLGSAAPPGQVVDGRLSLAGVAMARLVAQPNVIVPASNGDEDVVLTVPIGSLELRQSGGIDEALAIVELTAATLDVSTASSASIDWGAGLGLGQLALGHELVGASRQMLDLAREHALGRIQFGRPIAGFQAVRHRLAEALIAIESADALLAGAWDDRSPVSAAMAKAAAGRAARTSARHAQQVLAGIGFTTEHPFHAYVTRILVLDELLGSARMLTARLGTDILASRQLPPLLPL